MTRPASLRPSHATGPVRLAFGRRIGVYVVAGGVWATGVLWLVWRYFLRTQGPFGPEAGPLEPWWLRAHALFAFAAIWSAGLLWGVHVVNGWRSGRRRWSGGVLFGGAVLLIATGYLLYYLGDDRLRAVDSIVHWVIGLAAIAAFAWHRLRRSL